MLPSDQTTLFSYIDEHLPVYLEGLRNLAFSPGRGSSPRTPHTSLPALLEQRAFQLQTSEADLLVASRRGAGQHTLLLYHSFPVSQTPAASQVDTFYTSPSAHTFGTVAACLAALDAYCQTLGALPLNITWLIAGADAGKLARQAEMLRLLPEQQQAAGCLCSTGCLTAEGIPVIACGTKGLLKVALEVHTATTGLHAMYGAIAPNALWRLTWALSSLKNAHEEILIEGFYDALLTPQDHELEFLSRLPDPSAELAQKWGLAHLLWGLQGFQLHYAQLLTPTCTISEISSETMAAGTDADKAMPVYARACLNFFLVPDQDPAVIFQQLQQHFKANDFGDVSVRLLQASKPLRISTDAPFVQAIRRATTAAYAHDPWLLPYASEGQAMAAFQRILNLPCVLTGIGYPEEHGHSANKETFIDEFRACIKQLALIFAEVAQL